MNFVGVDVTGLDFNVFFHTSRLVYLVLYLAWCAWLWRSRRWVGVFVPVLLAFMFWAATTYPLQRNYGLGHATDRQRNLGWSATAAAGNAVWESGMNGRAHLEPAWFGLVSYLALRDPELVPKVYPFLPAFAMALVALGFWFGFRRSRGDDRDGDEDDEERGPGVTMLVLFFVLVASTQALDFMKTELGWTAKYMMLKPNHTAAFALVPVAVWLLAAPLTRWRSIASILVIGALGWAFVVFWLVFCAGVVLYAGARAVTKTFGRQELRMIVVLVAQLAIVAPYVYYLRVNFPQAAGFSAGKRLPEDPNRSPWGEAPPRDASLLFAATIDLGASFYLALYGMWVCCRRRSRFSHLWLALGGAAYLAWLGNGILYTLARARGAVHLHMFLILVVGVLAGIGAYALVRRAVPLVRHPAARDPVRLAAIGLLCWMPATLAWWWEPDRMDVHFRLARAPVEPRFEELAEWILANTEPTDVLCAGRDVMGWIPALTGRRVYRPRDPQRGVPFTDECSTLIYPLAELSPVGAKYLVADASLRERVDEGYLDEHPRLEKIFRAGDLDVYRLAPTRKR